MDLLAENLRDTAREQRLLDEVLELVRRCAGPPPPDLLDQVLLGRPRRPPVLPAQRRGGTS